MVIIEAKSHAFKHDLPGFSRHGQEAHYKLYLGYMRKYNELVRTLRAQQASGNGLLDLRSLKVDLLYALGGVKNHELYFDLLGDCRSEPQGPLAEVIDQHFGNFKNYLHDLKQTALASRGWAWTAFDLDHRHLFNYPGDAHNAFPVWNATPLVAVDMYEHAYFYDFGCNRPAYLDAFLKNLNWASVAERYTRALRVADELES